MSNRLSRNELVRLVEKIQKVEGTDEEIDSWIAIINHNAPATTGYVVNLLIRPHEYGLEDPPDPKDVVEKLLNYRPIAL